MFPLHIDVSLPLYLPLSLKIVNKFFFKKDSFFFLPISRMFVSNNFLLLGLIPEVISSTLLQGLLVLCG